MWNKMVLLTFVLFIIIHSSTAQISGSGSGYGNFSDNDTSIVMSPTTSGIFDTMSMSLSPSLPLTSSISILTTSSLILTTSTIETSVFTSTTVIPTTSTSVVDETTSSVSTTTATLFTTPVSTTPVVSSTPTPSTTPSTGLPLETIYIIAGASGGAVIAIVLCLLFICLCWCCCCKTRRKREYRTYGGAGAFVTARYWGNGHFQTGDSDSVGSRASSFRGSLRNSLRNSFSRISRRSRGSTRSDVYTNETAKQMYMTPL